MNWSEACSRQQILHRDVQQALTIQGLAHIPTTDNPSRPVLTESYIQTLGRKCVKRMTHPIRNWVTRPPLFGYDVGSELHHRMCDFLGNRLACFHAMEVAHPIIMCTFERNVVQPHSKTHHDFTHQRTHEPVLCSFGRARLQPCTGI